MPGKHLVLFILFPLCIYIFIYLLESAFEATGTWGWFAADTFSWSSVINRNFDCNVVRYANGWGRRSDAAREPHTCGAWWPPSQLQLLLEHRRWVRQNPAPQDTVPLPRMPHQPLHCTLLPWVPWPAGGRIERKRQMNHTVRPTANPSHLKKWY